MADISTLTGSIISEAENEAQNIIKDFKELAQKKVRETEEALEKHLAKLKREADTKANLENQSFNIEKKKVSDIILSKARMEFYSLIIEDAKKLLRKSPEDLQLSYILKKLERINIPDGSKISCSSTLQDKEIDRICKKYNLEKDKKINDFGFIISAPHYKETYTGESIFEERRLEIIKFLHLCPEVK